MIMKTNTTLHSNKVLSGSGEFYCVPIKHITMHCTQKLNRIKIGTGERKRKKTHYNMYKREYHENKT